MKSIPLHFQRGLDLFIKLKGEVDAAIIAAGPENPDSRTALSSMLGGYISYSQKHLEVIEQWGRFPHRNAILGREHTPEEEQGLASGTIAKF